MGEGTPGTGDTEMALLWRLADRADGISARAFQRGRHDIATKADGSPVTAVDVAVENRLRMEVKRSFPEDGFIGEEVGSTPGTSSRQWVVDGIDGTVAFTTGRPEWSTLIALTNGEVAAAGVLTAPSLGRRWVARVGRGAFRYAGAETPDRLAVSDAVDVVPGRTAQWPPASDLDGTLREAARRLSDGTGGHATRRASWGNGVPHGAVLVAEGRLDAFVLFGGGPWDHAAAQALVEAAGGAFTDLVGSRTIFGTGGVYSNGRVHDAILGMLIGHQRPAVISTVRSHWGLSRFSGGWARHPGT